MKHAVPAAKAILALTAVERPAPIVIARQGRVAIGDSVADSLGARAVAVLIGERPGRSVSDSLGLYITYAPTVGPMDSRRNCISNIHRHGQSYDRAARLTHALLAEAGRIGKTGVELKLDQATLAIGDRA
jgi:ethanolamine ammonia-lyase small subunit